MLGISKRKGATSEGWGLLTIALLYLSAIVLQPPSLAQTDPAVAEPLQREITQASLRFEAGRLEEAARRMGRESAFELGLLNRQLAYRRLAPKLTLGYSERRSNIDLYAFHRAYLRVGLVTEF